VLVLLATMWGFSPVNAQTATDDAVVSSATEVVVAPAAGSMSVTNTYEVAATGSDPLDEFEDWLPADAQGVETSSGSAVPTGEVTDGLVAWRVTLDEEIESGLSATVSLTYDLDLDGSPNDFAFAHPGLVSIAPTATAASTSLRVQVPGSWEVLEAAPGYGALDDGQSVFVADQPDPYLSQTLVLRSDAGFDTTSLESTVADLTVVFPAGVSVSAGTGLVALVDGLAAWLPLDPPDGFVVEYGYQTTPRSTSA